MLLFGPHIGLNFHHEFGKCWRKGCTAETNCCGSVNFALDHCNNGAAIPTNQEMGESPYEYRLSFIIREINKRKDAINQQSTFAARQIELVKQTYEIAKVTKIPSGI